MRCLHNSTVTSNGFCSFCEGKITPQKKMGRITISHHELQSLVSFSVFLKISFNVSREGESDHTLVAWGEAVHLFPQPGQDFLRHHVPGISSPLIKTEGQIPRTYSLPLRPYVSSIGHKRNNRLLPKGPEIAPSTPSAANQAVLFQPLSVRSSRMNNGSQHARAGGE